MVSFYAFPVIFIDTVTFRKGTLVKRAGVRTPRTTPGSASGTRLVLKEVGDALNSVA